MLDRLAIGRSVGRQHLYALDKHSPHHRPKPTRPHPPTHPQLGVLFFNPLLSLLAIAVLPLAEVVSYSETVLERAAHAVGDWLQLALGLGGWGLNLGRCLRTLVSLDAFCVLSGSVLTAYVGIDGLLYQMALDGCLPAFLLAKNAWRGTTHWIILCYLALATSQVLLLQGDVDALAGVYSFAFLGVMGIFSLGCMMLKTKRQDLPREVVAPWWCVRVLLVLAPASLGGPMQTCNHITPINHNQRWVIKNHTTGTSSAGLRPWPSPSWPTSSPSRST